MLEIQKVIPVTQAKKELLYIIKKMVKEDSTYTVTKNGVPVGVLMTPDRFEGLIDGDHQDPCRFVHPQSIGRFREGLSQGTRSRPQRGLERCMSAKFKLLYSETCRDQIRALSPTVKPLVKAKLEQIAANAYSADSGH